ncbi:MAG TPA: NAD+ synthase [Candidatus Methanoperedens sp.]|nr:NAD+ synthase [Candidatus Methanoperedens sp.]
MRQLNYQEVRQSIVKNIKNYVGDKNVFIGISGGIDSAVTASLCVKALGPKKVFGLMLPYGRQSDINDSKLVIEFLKIKPTEIDIKPLVDNFNFQENKFVNANIMSRVRMILLYAHANLHNGLVVGTTNKSEFEIGYFTKHGDGGCDLEPIANLYKTEIFEFAKFLKIPDSIINKKPSAGLWDGQSDEGELGFSYQELDNFLQGRKTKNLKLKKKIKTLIINSEHKRYLPPIISIK